MTLLHPRRRLKLFNDACPTGPMGRVDIFLVADSLSRKSSQRRPLRRALRQRFLDGGPRRGRRIHANLLGVPGQWWRGRRISVHHRRHDAHVHDEESHSQQIQSANSVFKPKSLGGPKKPCACSQRCRTIRNHQAVELLAQVVAASLNLAKELAESDLVLEALNFGYVPIIAFVFLYGKVHCFNEGDDLLRRSSIGCPVSSEHLRNDKERQENGGQNEDDGPLQPARVGHDGVGLDEAKAVMIQPLTGVMIWRRVRHKMHANGA